MPQVLLPDHMIPESRYVMISREDPYDRLTGIYEYCSIVFAYSTHGYPTSVYQLWRIFPFNLPYCRRHTFKRIQAAKCG